MSTLIPEAFKLSDPRKYTILFLNDENNYELPYEDRKTAKVIEATLKPSDNPIYYKYGNLISMFNAAKSVTTDYVLMNCGNIFPDLKGEDFAKITEGKTENLAVRLFYTTRAQETYRTNYYGYDYRIMLTVIRRDFPDIFKFYEDYLEDSFWRFSWVGLFKRSFLFDAFQWITEILGVCLEVIPERWSQKQNIFCEYMAPFLFHIYLAYRERKHPVETCGFKALKAKDPVPDKIEEYKKEYADVDRDTLLKKVKALVDNRDPETAADIVVRALEDREDIKDIRDALARYEKDRRYYNLTFMDKEDERKDWLKPVEKPVSLSIKSGRPKMLVYVWNSIGNDVNIKAFESFGFEIETVSSQYDFLTYSEDIVATVNKTLDDNNYDFVYSLNCNAAVAEACYIHDTPYIAWCYDSPSFTGAHWYLKYPTTYVFAFDSSDADNYKKAGIKQAYYLPLATNLDFFDKVVPEGDDFTKFSADISFIGSLYETPIPEAMGYLTDYQKGYFNALFDNQLDVYGHSFFDTVVTSKFTEWLDTKEFNRLINWDKKKRPESPDDSKAANPAMLKLLMNKQVTNKERLLLLNLLASHYEVKLYSYNDNPALKGIKFCGTADYYTEAPKVFRLSKLNLNATLRSIVNGIPLRCLDIMGCHGALLTNYQKDFDDHFRDGENVIFYSSAVEALEKANFYMSHEDLRQRIADNGYETIRKYYDYPVKIREMFEMADLQYLIPKSSV